MEVPDYDLPAAAIAQTPAAPRDSARLLVAVDPGAAPVHRTVADLPALVGDGDVIVVNTSRVLPARLQLHKRSGGAAEVMLLEPDQDRPGCWSALVRPGRRLPPGTVLADDRRDLVEVGERLGDGRRRVRLLAGTDEVMAAGTIPLPPYIRQPLDDPARYQTVYAETPGSVAAPTAGLHLTHHVLDRCRASGATVIDVDLAIGLGTFQPVTAARAEDHVMHVERYRVGAEAMARCREARRVIAVGTTSVRALETAAATSALEGRSDLFIRGDYPFRLVDVLLTNFHQPRSTLLLLLEAFYGPAWRDLYRTALDHGYRFLSFGDAMLVARRPAP